MKPEIRVSGLSPETRDWRRKIAAWRGDGSCAQGDSGVPSLNGEGMIEECGAVVKLEVFMVRDSRVRSN